MRGYSIHVRLKHVPGTIHFRRAETIVITCGSAGHERTGTGAVRPWRAGTRPLHAGTRRTYYTRERRPTTFIRVRIGMAVGTTTSPPDGPCQRSTRARVRRWEVAEDVRGRTGRDESWSGILAAVPGRLPKHRCRHHVRGHVASSGTLRNSILLLCTQFCDTLGLPSGAYIECPFQLSWTQVIDRYRRLTYFCDFGEDNPISAPTHKRSAYPLTLFGMRA